MEQFPGGFRKRLDDHKGSRPDDHSEVVWEGAKHKVGGSTDMGVVGLDGPLVDEMVGKENH